MDFTKPIKWLFNVDDRKHFYTSLNENERDKLLALVMENNTLKAQVGQMNADKREEYEKEKSKNTEQDIIHDLNEQQKELNENRFGKVIFLSEFYRAFLNDKKFRDSLEITDKDDNQVFGKFGDFAISSKTGQMLILDKYKNPISFGYDLRHVFFKPETLGNQLRRRRILVPRDKDFNPIPDYENIEVNDITYDDSSKTWAETIEFRDTVRNLLIKRDKENMKLREYIERLELAQEDQRKRLSEQERAISIYKNLNNTNDSELSQAMNVSLQTVSKLGDFQRKITNLTELKAMYEEQINAQKAINEKLLEKFKEVGDKTTYEEAKEEMFSMLERAKRILPEQLTIERETLAPEKKSPNPGEVLGQRRNV